MYILNILIFLIVLFLYIHINFYLTTSNYLEIYEVEFQSKEKFEELCNLKQPLLIKNFIFDDDYLLKNFNLNNINSNYGNFDIKLYTKENNSIPIYINLNKALEIFKNDISSNYLSENNHDFLIESSLIKNLSTIDNLLRPYGVSSIEYDMIIGSTNSYTSFKYTLNPRNFLYVIDGTIDITLTIPDNKKYLQIEKDYNNNEFYSTLDIYNVTDNFIKEYNKIKFMKIVLNKGDLLYIPSYWFYSLKLMTPQSNVINFKYTTYLSNISILPTIIQSYLQNKNIKNNFLKLYNI
tara:strand:- start:1909 stop:2787 length:879 start_codon:yes stop_codon:yes gene_type:complete